MVSTPALCRNADSLNYELYKKTMMVDSISHYIKISMRKKTDNAIVVKHVDDIMKAKFEPTTFMLDTDYVAIKHRYYLEAYRIKRVQFYMNLMHRRSKDIKYAKGWLRRAVE